VDAKGRGDLAVTNTKVRGVGAATTHFRNAFCGIMGIFVDGQPFTLRISPSLGLTLSSHPFWRRCTVSSLLGLKKERSMCFVECIWNANVTMTAI
jgi:hypothetical protein